MNKMVLSVFLFGLLGISLSASDFKSMDNKQLAEQAGKVSPEEIPQFRAEVHKRLQAMNEEERKAYKAQFKDAIGKNLGALSEDERKKREEEILKVIANKKKQMTMKEYRKRELDLHSCTCEGPFHDHKKKEYQQHKKAHHKHHEDSKQHKD
ncbi:DUF1104 domain-containing protein [Helicobacter cetorum]|uniref:DUF1104 domain-containing protein n=1 Tax=Helicobacter cetorum (strain ATCC BAA-429 / MIT 00-7128) TaxID=182217 RepID=I0ELI0_HELC0|nr:DUF1104 domain-containing protein [Helicobacter cetorum]AFI03799.1 hypothetical protein HCW_02590 [Helicobacter cetorum MIT 00-7128]